MRSLLPEFNFRQKDIFGITYETSTNELMFQIAIKKPGHSRYHRNKKPKFILSVFINMENLTCEYWQTCNLSHDVCDHKDGFGDVLIKRFTLQISHSS